MLVCSGPFQKAGRREVAFTQGYRNMPSEPVKNRFKIQMVWKSEPEIGPVRKRTIPLPYEQKRQILCGLSASQCPREVCFSADHVF